jgi:PAS domain S-box-containing protein
MLRAADATELPSPTPETPARPSRVPLPSADVGQELGRLRALIAHSVDPLDLLDREGRILYASPARERPLGYDDGFVGRSAFELIHPDDLARVGALFAELRQAACGETRRAQFRARHRDGTWRWLDSSATNLLDDPNVGAIVLSLRDVTEQKKAEAELRMSQRLASIGILAAGVGHEINNPLSCVISALSVAERSLASLERDAAVGVGDRSTDLPARLAHVHEGLTLARDGAARIAGVVGGLRALSRPDTPEPGRVAPAACIDSAIAIARAASSGRARFTREGDAVPDVVGDETRLGQVLLNLLTNAAQAIPEDRAGHVRVRTRAETPDRVVIEVMDNGSGIAAEHLPYIFDPFFTTKGRDEGTGLGLSITRRIVVALGGSIDADSTVGQGSTFRVTLPVAPGARSDRVVAVGAATSRPNVLVVDDEAQLVVALTAILEDEFEVRSATSAREALGVLRAGARCDVVLCDLMMRDMDGAEFQAKLAGVAPDLRARVVFMTGGAFTPDARAFLDRTTNPCLAKPLDVELLRRVLRERSAA